MDLAQLYTFYRVSPMHAWDNGNNWPSLLGFLIFIVLVLLLIALIIRSSDNNQQKTNEKSPLEYLQERFAKGEISKQEYNETKKELKIKE
jgi:putative membrane protein